MSRLYSVYDRKINEHGAIGGMRNGKGNRSTRRMPGLVPIFSPQTPYKLPEIEPRPPLLEAGD
jgi:hypothetical protein